MQQIMRSEFVKGLGRLQEFAGPMAHVLQSCWRIHGERLMHKPSGGSEGHNARNFSLALEVFIDALRLAPICEPSDWMESNGRTLLRFVYLLRVVGKIDQE